MRGDRYYVTLHAGKHDDVAWDLRSGDANGTSVRIAEGAAFTWGAALHQAGYALDRWLKGVGR